ncbi:hypothetical protein Taro_005917 [Colocasia esculenta]|uniref:ATP-dependent (S)-NAD(P)H-hydrate dehydratase n=1 Tax=Colocasia esculenta TaxID=4460 RepID=A0A843TPK3_COLES|nr:hypothetical protein [Colocasia esculenta]
MMVTMMMGASPTLSAVASGHRLATASAVLRRQQFLIRSLQGGLERQAPAKAMGSALEADSRSIFRRITPPLDPARYKGQAGEGADLSHVFCTKDAAPVIKSYSPELIVHPVLEESYSVRDDEKASVSQKVLAEATKWMERFDCLVVGPGLGRDPFLLDCVSEIIKHARESNIPIVIDGDGLFLVTNNLDLIRGYPLAVLTPNVNEYKRLVEKILGRNVDDHNAPEELLSLSRSIGGATILRKGKADLISDGKNVSMVSIFGSPRRCGGQGDILSGRLVSCNYLSFLDMYVPFVNNCTALCCKKAFLPVAIVFMLTKKSSHSPILRRV